MVDAHTGMIPTKDLNSSTWVIEQTFHRLFLFSGIDAREADNSPKASQTSVGHECPEQREHVDGSDPIASTCGGFRQRLMYLPHQTSHHCYGNRVEGESLRHLIHCMHQSPTESASGLTNHCCVVRRRVQNFIRNYGLSQYMPLDRDVFCEPPACYNFRI